MSVNDFPSLAKNEAERQWLAEVEDMWLALEKPLHRPRLPCQQCCAAAVVHRLTMLVAAFEIRLAQRDNPPERFRTIAYAYLAAQACGIMQAIAVTSGDPCARHS